MGGVTTVCSCGKHSVPGWNHSTLPQLQNFNYSQCPRYFDHHKFWGAFLIQCAEGLIPREQASRILGRQRLHLAPWQGMREWLPDSSPYINIIYRGLQNNF